MTKSSKFQGTLRFKLLGCLAYAAKSKRLWLTYINYGRGFNILESWRRS